MVEVFFFLHIFTALILMKFPTELKRSYWILQYYVLSEINY